MFGNNLFRLGDRGGAIQRHLPPIRWAASAILDPVDTLPVIAEMALGLVGFTAIVAVLRGVVRHL